MFGFLLKPIKKRFGADKHYYVIMDEIFGIFPNNIELYKLALIHRSASVFLPDGTAVNNERLEYLGDAVLEAIVSEHMFLRFPDMNEGFLTQLRSKIVSRQTLNEMCVRIGLSEHIISQNGSGIVQKHLNGDALEAMIGAIYLDKGYDFVNRLVVRVFDANLDLAEITATETDFKSRLIEWCQKSKHTIQFETKYCEDSTAQNPTFRSVAIIDGIEVGYGIGASKKEAEQRASCAVSEVMSDDVGDSLLELLDNKMQSEQADGTVSDR